LRYDRRPAAAGRDVPCLLQAVPSVSPEYTTMLTAWLDTVG
jgi:hypothetical protein